MIYILSRNKYPFSGLVFATLLQYVCMCASYVGECSLFPKNFFEGRWQKVGAAFLREKMTCSVRGVRAIPITYITVNFPHDRGIGLTENSTKLSTFLTLKK